jgi:Dimerisation domain
MSAVDQATTTAHAEVTPERILEIGGAYCASKTLMSAVELGLFTHLSKSPKSGQELEALMGLHPRATSDFLDALVAMRMLTAAGFGRDRVYANSPETAAFLD